MAAVGSSLKSIALRADAIGTVMNYSILLARRARRKARWVRQ